VRLQDRVPGFPGETALRIIEEDLGRPASELFDSFDPVPTAAASLGQMHVATLNGQKLAVKVQRQGLKELFDMDLKNIRLLAKLLDKIDPKSDGASRDWSSIYDESARLLYKEIDYEQEAQNLLRFKNNFKDVSYVRVPNVYLNMTSQRVVTMEFVEGIKINDIEKIEAAGIDRNLLAKRSAEAYLTQICRHGYFHCDPHPGNLACDATDGGTLIYYDFGMMDELKEEVRGGLVDLIFGIYENDSKDVCDSLEKIGVLKKNVDRVSVEKIARFFLNEFTNSIKPGETFTKDLTAEERAAVRKSRRQQLGTDLFSVGSDVPFKFPPTFTFVFRAFTTLDGIGKGLDPKYDLTRLAQPYLKDLVDLRDGSATLSFLKTWGKKLGLRPVDLFEAIQSPRNIAKLDRTITKMESGDLKLRVRNLETEKSFKRLELVQSNMALALAASAFLNMGILLVTFGAIAPAAASAPAVALGGRAFLGLAGLFGVQVPIGLLKVKLLDKKFASFDK
jgi:predicted unusual protein kinase regulating ubiquinone biosynthesis (AarF/ABC1/UbiB family)